MVGPVELLMILGILAVVSWSVFRWVRGRRGPDQT